MEEKAMNVELKEPENFPIVFTFSGVMNSGKDTCGKIAKQVLEEKGLKVLCINYADYLKAICARNFGYDDSRKEEFRHIIQGFGTMVRGIEQNFWINVVGMTFDVLRHEYDAFVISDVRYENEMSPYPYNLSYPFFNIYVERDIDENINEDLLAHESEAMALEPDLDKFHFIIDNNGTLQETHNAVKQMVEMCLDKKEEYLNKQRGIFNELLQEEISE